MWIDVGDCEVVIANWIIEVFFAMLDVKEGLKDVASIPNTSKKVCDRWIFWVYFFKGHWRKEVKSACTRRSPTDNGPIGQDPTIKKGLKFIMSQGVKFLSLYPNDD